MPILKNAKHERFAQGIADGKTQRQAYIDAGYADNEGSASRLVKSSQVAARIAGLLDEQRAETDQVKRSALAVVQYDATRIVLELAGTIQQSEDIAQRCMQVAPVTDDDGNLVMVETKTGKIAPAYTFDASGANKAIANKIKALHLLGIDAGRFVNRHEVRRSPLDSLSPELLRELELALSIALEQKPGLTYRTIEGEKPDPSPTGERNPGGDTDQASGSAASVPPSDPPKKD